MSSIACHRPARTAAFRAALTGALLFGAVLLVGCGGGEAEEPPLRVDAVGTTATDALIAESTTAGLTGRDAEGRIVPGLAQSWRVSDDGLSIVFRLRDAVFVGGRPVTAADVVASVERARKGPSGNGTRELLAGVTRVAAPLPDVVELRLSTPQPELLELLATPALAVRYRGRQSQAGPFTSAPEPIAPGATGPVADPSERPTRLTRNPDYFAAEAVGIAAATVRRSPPEAAIRRFNRGESDLVLGGELDGLGSARVTARRETLRLEQPRAALLLLVNQSRGALSELGVRNALQMAVNRDSLGPALFGTPAARPLSGLVPASIAAYPAPSPDWAGLPLVARQEEARRLLAEAGFDPVTARLRLAVAVSTSPADDRLMAAIAADYAAVGIDLVLIRRSTREHARAIAQGEFELALVRRASPINSPLPFLLPNLCGANRHGVCLPEADTLLKNSWTAPTVAERMAAMAAAERLWAEDGAIIGLVQPVDWSLVSPRLTGFATNASAVHALRHLSVTEDRRLLK
jgi:oligopeptide transport system substrate-binding protein